jgi:hypothetical protein
MDKLPSTGSRPVLFIGDVLVLGGVTIAGFATHNELQSAGARMLTTFVPLLTAWLMVGPFLGVYTPHHLQRGRDLWRPFWAMVLAGPMAALLRALWLGTTIVPIFVIVLGGIAALAIFAWRLVYWFFSSRRSAGNG